MFQNNDDTGSLIEGSIECSDSSVFKIQIHGEVRKTFGNKYMLTSATDGISLCAICNVCKRRILLFDSEYDGYDNAEKEATLNKRTTIPFCCKCDSEEFSVKVRYEYPSMDELQELGISNSNNAYTWIWVSLTCMKCGQRYTDFIDFETA